MRQKNCVIALHINISKKDIVPFADPIGKIRGSSKNIIYLEPHAKASRFDHEFSSLTYRKPIREIIHKYQDLVDEYVK